MRKVGIIGAGLVGAAAGYLLAITPGVREIVRDGVDGLLAPPGDVDALARRLETLLADAALRHRLGEAARRGVVERYGPERIVRCWEELFAFLER